MRSCCRKMEFWVLKMHFSAPKTTNQTNPKSKKDETNPYIYNNK